MRKPLTEFFLLGICLLSGSLSWAAKSATVSVDGAMVYRDASFDAPVIAYLKKGKQVVISNRTYGPFFKVKLRPGLMGYISDIDVRVEGGGGGDSASQASDDFGLDDNNDKSPKSSRPAMERPKQEYDKPIFAIRSLGIGGGIVNFKDQVLQQRPSANVTVFGLKLTGPNLLFPGPYIFDINALFSFSPPKFIKEITDPGTDASGLLGFFDINLLFPIATGFNQNWMVYIGGGPFAVYSKFSYTHSGQLIDDRELVVGGSFVGGLAYRIGRMMLKVDGKYFIEKEASYFGVLTGIQREF